MKVLIIDDDLELQQTLARTLRTDGFVINQAQTATRGATLVSMNNYDAIILDINLPDGDGLDLCNYFRQKNILTPILVLSIKSNIIDRVKGLNIGADDYLIKPFSKEELVARLHSLIRRYKISKPIQYSIGKLTFDPFNQIIILSGQKFSITNMESKLLSLLFRSIGAPISRQDILEKIYGEEYPITNTIDVTIHKLRKKLKTGDKSYIKSIRSVGYKIVDPDSDEN